MERRLKLDAILREIMGDNPVFFNPPESVKLKYPCLIYRRTGGSIEYANNGVYRFTREYTLTLIDENPDSEYIDKLIYAFPGIEYGGLYVSDNLNHDTFTIYY